MTVYICSKQRPHKLGRLCLWKQPSNGVQFRKKLMAIVGFPLNEKNNVSGQVIFHWGQLDWDFGTYSLLWRGLSCQELFLMPGNTVSMEFSANLPK